MMLTWKNWTESRKSVVLLGPARSDTGMFHHVVSDPGRHQKLLAAAQQLRGRIYLADEAITLRELSSGGRHVQAADELSWHLLIVDENGVVAGCIRYLPHREVAFRDLAVSRSAIAQSPLWGPV